MNRPAISVVLLSIALLASCARQEAPAPEYAARNSMAFARAETSGDSEFLAYEHTLVIDIRERDLPQAYANVRDACTEDRANTCTILDADLNQGERSSAHIRMRIKPAGVDNLADLASASGDVVRRSTHVEDLARTITDLDKRIAILTTTRDKLVELEQRGANDVQSLITITTELTRVQAELEDAMGQSAYQRQRVNLDILNIEFVVDSKQSFWRPIGDALAGFGRNLASGLADTITAVAYLLPWSMLVLVLAYGARLFWRRRRPR